MRFKIGKPFGMDCDIENANRLVIHYGRVHVIGFFVGLAAALLVYGAWRMLLSNALIFKIYDAGPGMFLGSLAVVAVLHELCHLIAHPKFGISQQSHVGFEPKSGLPYAAYIGVMTRNRAIIILLAPFFALTLLPFALAFFVQMPDWAYLLAWCSLLNTALAGGDLCMTVLALKYVPTRDFVHGEFYGPTVKKDSLTQAVNT